MNNDSGNESDSNRNQRSRAATVRVKVIPVRNQSDIIVVQFIVLYTVIMIATAVVFVVHLIGMHKVLCFGNH